MTAGKSRGDAPVTANDYRRRTARCRRERASVTRRSHETAAGAPSGEQTHTPPGPVPGVVRTQVRTKGSSAMKEYRDEVSEHADRHARFAKDIAEEIERQRKEHERKGLQFTALTPEQ